jgi:iron(III) transport system ATP-binding protein
MNELGMKKVSVECRNLRLSYGPTEVLKGVSLDIEPGEFFALLGPSGSGKSTLLRLMAGFNRQHGGVLRVDGQDIGHLPPWQRNVGMVFQNYALWPHMTVWDNVAFGLVERKVEKAALQSRVAAALELVGLASFGQRRPSQLSGGQQQRVALARTLVIEPQVLLLDEPLSNLDKSLRVQMRQELLALQRRLGLTTIFVTHDQEEAMTTADRMAVLNHGVLQQVGTPTALYDEPANAFVAGFVGTMNLLPARPLRSAAGLAACEVEGLGELPLPTPVPAPGTAGASHDGNGWRLSFRPHALQVHAAGAQGADEAAAGVTPTRWLRGVVEASEFLGEATRYRVRVGPHALVADHPHRAGRSLHAPGSEVRLGLELSQLRLLNA